MTTPPPTLDYTASRPPEPPEDWRTHSVSFMAGLFLGVGASAALWVSAWKLNDNLFNFWTIGGIVLAKLLLAVLVKGYLPRYRGAVPGLIGSVPVGILIFGWSAFNATCRK